ncbi:uncharacterized protein LOC114524939 [Dendronephthya gigantea]|uniref:uncharacterized protein LOC114524939 n=1 Tax=Dendronephthya gigantea TaxID=151771 RepID=UPI00106B9609|nr:uncharacterized protein LOC114524939 [Dendronephthya gigantea]
MPRIRLRRKAICYFVLINIILFVLYNLCVRWDKNVSLKKLTVNSSMKHFIQKLVPIKQKRVLTFEIGKPKPEGKPSVCRFTQSDGLELLAEKYLYPGNNPADTKCAESISVKICAVSGSFKSFQVSCEHNPCGKIVKVGSLIKETGQIQWEDVNSSKLEKFIQEFVLKNLDQMFPFFYLKCSGNINFNTGIANQPTQLVSVPLASPTNISHVSKKDINVNVNIIFLDAVSRRHLYRSLPKTIAAFRNVNLNPKSSSNVLDFELYQALRTTPKETLSGFLKGKSNTFQNTTEKTMLSFFKKAGYQILWQEDECWKSDVGVSWYFGVHNSKIQNDLNKLKIKLKSESIDSFGLTHSSCLRNDVNNKENTLTSEICMNGRYHHDYLFDYVVESLNHVNNKLSSTPVFSFTSISLGKEESGRKIQLLDNSLATFVTKMAADKNTITILISGHGNTFDTFPVQTMEGQYEKWNITKMTRTIMDCSMKLILAGTVLTLICSHHHYVFVMAGTQSNNQTQAITLLLSLHWANSTTLLLTNIPTKIPKRSHLLHVND